MNKKEFTTFAMALKTYYPKENLIPNDKAMELWYRQLQDMDYEVAGIALNKWVATNKWSPTIADIREQAAAVVAGEKPLWSDGWAQVQSAMRKYGSYRVKMAMESFDPITRQTVERLGFTNLCMSSNVSADRANFRMVFEQLAERQQMDRQLPAKLKRLIEGKGADSEGKGLLTTDRKD